MDHDRPREHLNQIYLDISRSLAATSDQLGTLRVEHKEGQKTLGGIRERLAEIRASFDGELGLLQEQAEWDKFTIAFFGETNAGKSTVLEALRILFSEEGRQALLDANDRDLLRYEQALKLQIDSVRATLQGAVHAHAERLMTMQEETARLSAIVQGESTARIRWRYVLFAALGASGGAALTYFAFAMQPGA